MTQPVRVRWTLGDLAKSEACVGCGHGPTRPARPVEGAGFDPDALIDWVPPVPLCAACHAEQRLAARRLYLAPRVLLAVAALAPAVALTLAPVPPAWVDGVTNQPPALVLAVAALSVAAAWCAVRAWTKRSRWPVVLLEGARRAVVVQSYVAANVADNPARHYREAAGNGPEAEPVQGPPARPKEWLTLALWGSCAAAFMSAWGAWQMVFPRVMIANSGATPRVVRLPDGRSFTVGPDEVVVTRARAGRFDVVVRGEGRDEARPLTLPTGRAHLLDAGGDGCWMVHDVRDGFGLAPPRAAEGRTEWVARGAWVPVTSPRHARRVECPIPAWGW
ncbi:MAG: hypothetical protein R3A52_14490 [Polyangiales bacterium]